MLGSERVREAGWVRWRWRLLGAAMWPAFAICATADAVLLVTLPPSGESTSAIDAFVVDGALNLVIVAVLAPLAGLALRRVRPDLPRVVARDHAGTALLIAATVTLLVVGLLG